ncbi:NAD(P)H-binding protein [Pinirhizobacter soli]|uniref:NmrA family NAD(P)-binding protein n=1 Tax=Pinirhizobacter soli TaxID=2786953 RepID=UPI00202A4BA0|nr:NAD(P)H-binding protein [Pinirhizobacter soli]
MFVVVGATGNVGFATSLALRKAGAPVRAVVRDSAKAAPLRELGCDIVLADLNDADAVAKSFADATAVQIIIPVAPRDKDPAAALRHSIDSLIKALKLAPPKRVLAISDYGAHVADDIGMPTVFRGFEQLLGQLDVPKLILRSAEHMHNWARVIPVALESGILPTFHDQLDMTFPTIAAPDLGRIAAELLLRPADERNLQVCHAEGPRRYSANDVAAALTELSGRTIVANAVPRSQWKQAFEKNMTSSLAELLIKANDAQNRGGLVDVELGSAEVFHGETVLIDALRPLLARS